MKTISIEMPLVKRCDAEKCGFNKNNDYHVQGKLNCQTYRAA